MEVHEAKKIIQQLVVELEVLRSAAATATRKAVAVSKIIGGYIEMFPELGPLLDQETLFDPERTTDEDAPKGAEAVRLILQDAPDQWFYVSNLVAALREREWLPHSDNPANAVRTALERLINTPDSDVKKGRDSNNKVIYSYRPDDAPPRSYPDEEPF
jgi:hypothetical protein